jgi:nitroreductase
VEQNLISNDSLLSQLNWRYAVKKFDPAEKISSEDWEALEDALILSPSSYGLQPWKFVVVTDEEVRKELVVHSWNQPQIVECSHLVVIAAKKDSDPDDIEKYLNRVMEVRGTPESELEVLKGTMLESQKTAVEKGFINEWSARQCFISLGFLLSAAAVRGIDSCPIEGFIPEEYDRVLGIDSDGYFSVVVCALGYRNSEDDWLSKLGKVRFPKEEIIKRI